MKNAGLTLVSLLLIFFARSQNPLDQFKNMNMREIGPAVMSGRVTAIDVEEAEVNTLWVGTASGGAWRSANNGYTWESVFDQQDVLGIGALKIDPINSDVVWVGTGEGNPRNSQTSGSGIFKSVDRGRSWSKMGLDNTKTIHRIVIDPHNTATVYAGALGSAWGPNTDRGVFKTTDGGTQWQKVLFVNDSVGCADLVIDKNHPNKLFAAMWHYGRQPWFFNSGGKGSGLYVSTDHGGSWKKLDEKNGLPKGNLGRIGIAIAPSNSSVVYAMIEAAETGLYKSTDGGFQWELVTTKEVNDRPFYYHEFYVDPTNENHLIYLHSTVSESIDGGQSWSTMLPYYGVHPDHHAFWWSASNPKHMIEGNDGGLNFSEDGGQTWRFANNLPLGQFYHINFDMETPYNVYGGLQDNGSWKGPGYVWHSGGIQAADWQEVSFGDGFDVVPRPDSTKYVWAMSQGGYLEYINTETGESRLTRPVHPEGKKLRFNWNAAIAQDPANPCGVYYGSQFVHYTADCGLSWKIISPDLTTNNPDRQKANESGGLTIDATAAENYCTLLAISPSPVKPSVIWVGTDDGQVHITLNSGELWQNVTKNIKGLPLNAWIAQVTPSPTEEGTAYVVANNYRQNDWEAYAFRTSDYGKTWTRIVQSGQVNGHCLSFVQDGQQANLWFLGTEHGLYVTKDAGKAWHKWSHNYPSVATQDMKIHPREGDLILGTFGRAVYILDNIRPLRQWAKDGEQMFKETIRTFELPAAYQASYKRHNGERFPADSYYSGDNKEWGAQLIYFVPAVEKEKKVKVAILNTLGDTLRWFLHEPDTGLNAISWNFDTNGFDFPSRDKREVKKEPEGGGFEVEPGSYKIVFDYLGKKDSTTLQVLQDPRAPFISENYTANLSVYNRFKKAVVLSDAAFEQVKTGKNAIERVKLHMTDFPDSAFKSLQTRADSLFKKLTEIEALFFLPENATGIREDGHLLVSQLYGFYYGYLSRGSAPTGENAQNALLLLEKKSNDVAAEIDLFYEKQFEPWQKEVQELTLPFFSVRKKLKD